MYIVIKEKIYTPETGNPINRSFSSLLLSNGFIFVIITVIITVIIIRGQKILYFCNPTALLILEKILFISILFLLHIRLQPQSIIGNS